MTDEEIDRYHVYSNGTDWLVGTSADEAVGAFCAETGDNIADYSYESGRFVQCRDEAELTIGNDDDNDKNTRCRKKTMREWIREQLTVREDGSFSRLLCSTEY